MAEITLPVMMDFKTNRGLALYRIHVNPDFYQPKEKRFLENFVENGENTGNQHFLLFPQYFLTFPNQISIFELHLFCRVQMLSIWTILKSCRL